MLTGWATQFGSAAIAAFLTVGCSGSMSGSGHGHMAMAQGGAPNGATSATKAAELRASLNYLMGEHILLASSATGAALDANSVDIARAIGSVYGQGAQDA
jgi:hypothetical protein